MDKLDQLQEEIFRSTQEVIFIKQLLVQELLSSDDLDELQKHLKNAYYLITQLK